MVCSLIGFGACTGAPPSPPPAPPTGTALPARGGLATEIISKKYHSGAPTELPPTLAPTPSLTLGPVVGAVTPNSARVFVRTDRPAQVQMAYGRAADLSDANTSAAQMTDLSADFTTQIPLQQLASDTTYYLDVRVNGVSQFRAPYPKFKTFPPVGSSVSFQWVHLTDFSYKPSPAFEAAAKENPDFVIIGGDFDHSNPETLEQKRQMFRELYDINGTRGDLVKFILRQFSVAHFWDDHDIGVNNADRTYTLKGLALQVLKEYFPLYPVAAYGDWQSFSYAQADFFLLDARSERDPDTTPNGPGKSMLDGDHLGAQGQLEWLEQGLLTSKATWKFILSPVVFNRTTLKLDAWYGFGYERAQLVQFIRAHNIHGIIFISGDSHFGGLDDGTNSDFPEMQVPSPNYETCMNAVKPGTWTNGEYGEKNKNGFCAGYGVITVLTNPDRVLMQVQDPNGQTLLHMLISQEASK